MNRKELTKTVLMISNWGCLVKLKKIQKIRGKLGLARPNLTTPLSIKKKIGNMKQKNPAKNTKTQDFQQK